MVYASIFHGNDRSVPCKMTEPIKRYEQNTLYKSVKNTIMAFAKCLLIKYDQQKSGVQPNSY